MPSAGANAFTVQVGQDWAAVEDQWRAHCTTSAATPFQTFDWLDGWYRHIAPASRITPQLVTVTDADSGGLVMLLPLASVPSKTGSVLQFADNQLSDYNAPLLGPVPVAAGSEPALWAALCRVLPRHAVAEFRKMPVEIAGRANPLAKMPGARPSSLTSNELPLPASFSAFHANLEKRTRVQIDRCGRGLAREGDVTFERITDEATALRVLDVIDLLQHERFTDIGSTFSLDAPAQSAFYRHRLGERLADGRVFLTALRLNDQIIAAIYAVADGERAVVLRLASDFRVWSRVSPGLLVVHRSIELMCSLGFKTCDLSIGDYEYKRRFGTIRAPLIDLVAAMSWRGQAAAARHWAAGALRARPALDQRVRSFVGRVTGVPKARVRGG